MSKSNGRKKLQLNPAFANAHGLSEEKTADPCVKLKNEVAIANSTASKISRSIDEARKTGKLLLNSIELKLPLPSAIFDLRNDLVKQFDGKMDGDDKFWNCYGEEMLTVLDLSNNDFSKNVEKDENYGSTSHATCMRTRAWLHWTIELVPTKPYVLCVYEIVAWTTFRGKPLVSICQL